MGGGYGSFENVLQARLAFVDLLLPQPPQSLSVGGGGEEGVGGSYSLTIQEKKTTQAVQEQFPRSCTISLEGAHSISTAVVSTSMSGEAPVPGLSASAPAFTPGSISTTSTRPGSSSRRRRGQPGSNGEEGNRNSTGNRGPRRGGTGGRGRGASPGPAPAATTTASGGHTQTASQEVCTCYT